MLDIAVDYVNWYNNNRIHGSLKCLTQSLYFLHNKCNSSIKYLKSSFVKLFPSRYFGIGHPINIFLIFFQLTLSLFFYNNKIDQSNHNN